MTLRSTKHKTTFAYMFLACRTLIRHNRDTPSRFASIDPCADLSCERQPLVAIATTRWRPARAAENVGQALFVNFIQNHFKSFIIHGTLLLHKYTYDRHKYLYSMHGVGSTSMHACIILLALCLYKIDATCGHVYVMI